MLVPATLAASTSPSPANVPPVNATVALAMLRLSGSATVTDGDSVTAGPFSVKDALVVPASVGASSTPTTVSVVVVTLLAPSGLPSAPSSTFHVIVRVVLEP